MRVCLETLVPRRGPASPSGPVLASLESCPTKGIKDVIDHGGNFIHPANKQQFPKLERATVAELFALTNAAEHAVDSAPIHPGRAVRSATRVRRASIRLITAAPRRAIGQQGQLVGDVVSCAMSQHWRHDSLGHAE